MYSPKVKEELVRELYQLKQVNKRPMTSKVTELAEVWLMKQ